MESGAELGIAGGTQWWYPKTPLQCKVVNHSKAPLTLQQGGVVARIYAVNTSDKERMQVLLDPAVPEEQDTGCRETEAGRDAQPMHAAPEEGGGGRVRTWWTCH